MIKDTWETDCFNFQTDAMATLFTFQNFGMYQYSI